MVKFLETEEQVSKEHITELEKKLGFEFPSDYVKHLMEYNGGRCEPNLFSFEEDGKFTQSSVDWFLALYDGEFDNLETYFRDYKIDVKRMPTSFFPIAHDPGGNLICMDKIDGRIYFWNHEKEVDYFFVDDSERSNLYFIAENLDEFISNLSDEFA